MFVESLVERCHNSSKDLHEFDDEFEDNDTKNHETKNSKNDQADYRYIQSKEKALKNDHTDSLKCLSRGGDELDQPASSLFLESSELEEHQRPSTDFNQSSHQLHSKTLNKLNLENKIQNGSPDYTTEVPDQGTGSQDETIEKQAESIEEICRPRYQSVPNDLGCDRPSLSPQPLYHSPSSVSWNPNGYQAYPGPVPIPQSAFGHPFSRAWHGDFNASRLHLRNHFAQPHFLYSYPLWNNWLAPPVSEPMPFYPKPEFYAPPRPFFGPAPVYPNMYGASPQTPFPKFHIGQQAFYFQPSSWKMSQKDSEPLNRKSFEY